MRLKQWFGKGLLAASVAGLMLVGGVDAQAPASGGARSSASLADRPYPGSTYPSIHSGLSLHIPRVVREVPVKSGSIVKKGDLLLAEDDRDEQVRLRQLDVEARNAQVAIEYEKARVEFAKNELKKKQYAFDRKAASDTELREKELEVTLAELQVKKAEHDFEKAQMEVERQKQLLEQMRILAPHDGIVEDVSVKVGEVVDHQKPAIMLVQNDPLWVQVSLPAEVSLKLAIGQELGVQYGSDNTPKPAKVIYIAPVADAAANRHIVRLEMPNPENRPSGLRVNVVVPPSMVAADKR